MNQEILLTLAVAVGALALFMWGRFRVDVVGLMVMAAIVVLGLLPPEQAVRGFANEATVTVALVLALSAGLLRTGAVDILRNWIARFAGDNDYRLLVVTIATVLPVSAFINNTAAVAILMPMILGLSREMGTTPSRLLMPLSYAGQMGGTLTLIGTSTNLLVAGLVLDLGEGRLGLFEITPPALVLAVVGVTYLLTVGWWLVPERDAPEDLLESYKLREYLTGMVVEEHSPVDGATLEEARFEETYGLHVIQIEREGERIRSPQGRTRMRAGDVLLVQGRTPDIAQAVEEDKLTVRGTPPELSFEDEDDRLAELLVPRSSRAVGRTPRELRLRAQHGIVAIAVQRRGQLVDQPISDITLAPGDVLLVAGPEEKLQDLHEIQAFSLLGAVDVTPKRTRKIRYSVPILLAVVLLAAFDVMSILVAALLGVIAMIVTGCVKPEEIYEDLDWMVIILLGTILALGIAMQETGTAAFLAQGLVDLTRPWGTYGTLAAVYLLTSVLTELISNNAAAVVLTPIAVATADALGISPMPLIVAVMFAASNSFMTPIGYQTNTFIYGPGGYRFTDFLRVGAPLNLMMLIAATIAIPLFFPF